MNNLMVTRGEVAGHKGENEDKGFQEQLQKIHGQNQGGMKAGEGSGDSLS